MSDAAATEDKDPIRIGDLVKDLVTSFEGIVVGHTRWLHGCDRLSVQPQKLDDKGQPHETQTFDVMRLELVERQKVPYTASATTPDFTLGDRVRDTLTGFGGICGAITEWFGDTLNISIEPTELDENGQPRKNQVFNVDRVALVSKKSVPVSKNTPPERVENITGGPQRGESVALSRRMP